MSECRKQKPAGTNPAGRTAPSAAQTSILGIPIISRAPALGEELAAGLESPRVGSSTSRSAARPAAHTWLLCPLGRCPRAALTGDGQTPRIVFATPGDLQAICGAGTAR